MKRESSSFIEQKRQFYLEEELKEDENNFNRFVVLDVDCGMAKLMNSSYHVVNIPCKYLPFQALKKGSVVKISFKKKREKLRKEITEFEKRILEQL